KLWINNSPSAYTIDSARNLVFRNIHGIPSDGTVYRFIPKAVAVSVPPQAKTGTISIYPNPANGKLYYSSAAILTETLRVTIADLSGRVMSTTVLPARSSS